MPKTVATGAVHDQKIDKQSSNFIREPFLGGVCRSGGPGGMFEWEKLVNVYHKLINDKIYYILIKISLLQLKPLQIQLKVQFQ